MTVRCPHCKSEPVATWLEFGDPNVHRVMVICNGCKVKHIAGPLKGKYAEAPFLAVFDEKSDENELEAKRQYVELLKKHTEWIPAEVEKE